MERSRFCEERIIEILCLVEARIREVDLCRKHCYPLKWRPKYDGNDVSKAMRLRQHEVENVQLRKMIADQALGISTLKDIHSKNF